MGSNQDLIIRRKQLRYRANHRGIKEMDIILGKFADQFLIEFSDVQLDAFECLMDHNDRDLLQWFTGEKNVSESVDPQLFEQISNFASGNLKTGYSG